MADANITSTPKAVEGWKNPHFDRINRAPYELGQLLQRLPEDLSPFSPTTPEVFQIAAAAAEHASNANDTLMEGMEALGDLLFVAGANQENTIDPGNLSRIGSLLQHLAVEGQFLQETALRLRSVTSHRPVQVGVKKGGA
jgi:hypothetical protein